MSTDPFDKLPEEMVNQIIAQLDDVKDLHAAALVCKRFQDHAYYQLTLPEVGKVQKALEEADKALDLVKHKVEKYARNPIKDAESFGEAGVLAEKSHKRTEKLKAAWSRYHAAMAELTPLLANLEHQAKRTKKF